MLHMWNAWTTISRLRYTRYLGRYGQRLLLNKVGCLWLCLWHFKDVCNYACPLAILARWHISVSLNVIP